jgi:hypothetical protein
LIVTAEYIPDTDIPARHHNACRAPSGQYRVIVLDTMTGEENILIRADLPERQEAEQMAERETGGPVSQGGGPMVNKTYVFDDQGTCIHQVG